MYEKVSKYHPDKLADRIAGAIVDLAYSKNKDAKVAVEVLIGHGEAYIINETNTSITYEEVKTIVYRIVQTKDINVTYKEVAQDVELAKNQEHEVRAGDNGIFKGTPTSDEEEYLANLTHRFDDTIASDGKYIVDEEHNKVIVCQSNASEMQIKNIAKTTSTLIINPLGEWTGGTNVDSGATNRKLGSDLGEAVTGGGLHGKDLSKADVSVTIVCNIIARDFGKPVTAACAIGDNKITFHIGEPEEFASQTFTYERVVESAKNYIDHIGGFEKLAEYGLIR